jgi:hypothetical protein
MRPLTARRAGAVLAAALLTLPAACSSSTGDSGKAAACGDMRNVISSFNHKTLTDPASTGAAYARAAQQIRTRAARVKDDTVKNTALQVAQSLDALAAQMRSLAAGNYQVPDVTGLTSSVAQLQHACGSR